MVNPEEDQEKARQEAQRRIAAIMDHACMIYDLMEPGMTVNIELEEPQQILTPNHPPKMKRLIVTRPAIVLEVKDR